MKLFTFKNFKKDESGAVTVDWVVLTAAIVLLGGIVVNIISTGLKSLATKIDAELSAKTVGTSG
jgi:Flp pilus assembly pilin Flp